MAHGAFPVISWLRKEKFRPGLHTVLLGTWGPPQSGQLYSPILGQPWRTGLKGNFPEDRNLSIASGGPFDWKERCPEVWIYISSWEGNMAAMEVVHRLSNKNFHLSRLVWLLPLTGAPSASSRGQQWPLIWHHSFPGGSEGKESICLQYRRPRFNTWVGKFPWRRKWQPTPVFLPEEFHGQRSLAGYSPLGCKKSDTTEQLTLSLYFYFSRG